MKILKYISAFAVLALLGLSSCTTDVLTSNNSASQGKGRKVSLTLGSTAKTRSANLGGFDREKAIDGNKLYAVVFDQQGKFVETIAIADYDSSDGSCSFTLSDAGVYYGYIIANTSKGTDLSGLTAGTSTEDDLFNIIEDTDPGADLASSTNFLMTSKRTLLDVDGDADTSLGTITLTRAVVRIDIDATAITGLAITKVEVQSRYKKSLIIRGNSPADATLAAATPTDTKTYTRGTGSGEVPTLDGTSTGQDHALVTDREWQGVIYGYENIDPTTTVVKITHTLNGVASTTTVNFADANSGAGQALKRNNIYTVKLSDGAPTPTLKDITATITVTDWDTSTNLSYKDLTDHAMPDFEVTSSHIAKGFTSGSLNPNLVYANWDDDPTEIALQITSNGKVASEVSFVNKTGVAYDFMGDGGAIDQISQTYAGGKIVQNYIITIPQSLARGLIGNYFTFKVHNVFDDTSTASREFIVRSRSANMNPLWWVAEYNLDFNSSSNYTFPNTNDTGNGYMYNWQTIMNSCFAYRSTSYDGWQIPSGSGKQASQRTINGVPWHLPTRQEWESIIPTGASYNGSTTVFTHRIFDTGTTNGGYINPLTVKTEPSCVFGFNSTTQTPHAYYSYWSDIYHDTTNKIKTRYAIRFLDTDYCSVWKYEVRFHYTIIRSKLIEVINHDELTKLSSMMATITSSSFNWDESTFDVDAGEISRKFYASGFNAQNQGSQGNASGPGKSGYTDDQNPRGHWYTASEFSNNSTWAYYICMMYDNAAGSLAVTSNAKTYGFNIRLFRDE